MGPWKHRENTSTATHYTPKGERWTLWVERDEYGSFWDSGIDKGPDETVRFGRSATKYEAMARCEIHAHS